MTQDEATARAKQLFGPGAFTEKQIRYWIGMRDASGAEKWLGCSLWSWNDALSAGTRTGPEV